MNDPNSDGAIAAGSNRSSTRPELHGTQLSGREERRSGARPGAPSDRTIARQGFSELLRESGEGHNSFGSPLMRDPLDAKALPQRRKQRRFRNILPFLILFVLPVAAAGFYYFNVASNQYVVEFRFVVQDTTTPTTTSAPSILASMLGASVGSPTMTQNYIVTNYLTSRQAVDDLQAHIKVRDFYTGPDIDWWARFDPSRSTEAFVGYWQRMVTATNDYVTGIASVKVRAFTPQDAKLIGDTMMALSEELVNTMGDRAKRNAVRFAEGDVKRAEDRLKENRKQLTEFRNKYGLVDPAASIVASNSTLSQTLRATLSQLEMNRASLLKQNVGAAAASIQALNSQIKATKEQIALVESQVAKPEGSAPISEVVSQYEILDLERQFAQTMMTNTLTALDQARAYAASQQVYITPFVRVALPDSSTYPRRLASVMVVAAFAGLAWVVFVLIARSVRDYQV